MEENTKRSIMKSSERLVGEPSSQLDRARGQAGRENGGTGWEIRAQICGRPGNIRRNYFLAVNAIGGPGAAGDVKQRQCFSTEDTRGWEEDCSISGQDQLPS